MVTFLPAPHGQTTAEPTVPNTASVVQAPSPPESPPDPPLPTQTLTPVPAVSQSTIQPTAAPHLSITKMSTLASQRSMLTLPRHPINNQPSPSLSSPEALLLQTRDLLHPLEQAYSNPTLQTRIFKTAPDRQLEAIYRISRL